MTSSVDNVTPGHDDDHPPQVSPEAAITALTGRAPVIAIPYIKTFITARWVSPRIMDSLDASIVNFEQARQFATEGRARTYAKRLLKHLECWGDCVEIEILTRIGGYLERRAFEITLEGETVWKRTYNGGAEQTPKGLKTRKPTRSRRRTSLYEAD